MEKGMRTRTNSKKQLIAKKAGMLFLLAVLGYGISLLGQIPQLRFFSLFPIDFSNLRVVCSYAIYGFYPALFVLLFKAARVSLTFFSKLCFPFPIFLVSSVLDGFVTLLLLFWRDWGCHVFSKGFFGRLYGYWITSFFNAIILGYLSYLFIIPTRASGNKIRSVFSTEMNRNTLAELYPSVFKPSYYYPVASFIYGILYFFIRHVAIFFLYEVLFNKLIFDTRKSPILGSKVFRTEKELTHFSPFDSIENAAIRLGEDKIRRQEKINKRNKTIQEEDDVRKDINQNLYVYVLHVDEFGVRREVRLSSFVQSTSIILAYLTNIYPKQNYKILSYQRLEDTYTDASTDGLSKEVFYQIHKCDKITTCTYDVSVRIR